ncbi:MAG: sugar MFS transporter [Caulobacteraceae bacterium]|nr:sugar MFS transporter [Caulobacteraceae bacterium]
MQTTNGPAHAQPSDPRSNRLIPLAMALFFAFGFCTVLVDTLTPKLKGMFALSYTEVMLTPFAFFGAYFLVSLPASWLLAKIGYLQSVVVGLAITAAGCLLFTPAASAGLYSGFLGAVFVMASGVTIVQVAANPLTTAIGDPRFTHSRLTLAQAFNSLATMIGPLFGSALILAHSRPMPDPHTVSAATLAVLRKQEAHAVQGPFMGIAVALVLLAILCSVFFRLSPPSTSTGGTSYRRLLGDSRLMLGVVSIFAYVGAEVSIGSLMTNYLMSGTVLAAKQQTAGSLVSIYWGLAMVGRFIGAFALRKVRPGSALALCALGAGLLATVSGLSGGLVAAAAVLAIGLFNSIMFPTIFTLAIEDLGDAAPQGSGLLCLAIVGGAVVPLISGRVADTFGLTAFLAVPVVCYLWIAAYGLITRRGELVPEAAPLMGEAAG